MCGGKELYLGEEVLSNYPLQDVDRKKACGFAV
jgi:hypothetical protein